MRRYSDVLPDVEHDVPDIRLPSPTEAEIRHGLEGNMCRCTGYQNIVRAVQLAAEQMSEK